MRDRDNREIKENDVYYWPANGQYYTIVKSQNGRHKKWRFRDERNKLSPMTVNEKNLCRMVRVVKGEYILTEYGDPSAFECLECRCAMTIVADPAEEAPNYCFNCGVKFDWRGVYEALLDEMYKEME